MSELETPSNWADIKSDSESVSGSEQTDTLTVPTGAPSGQSTISTVGTVAAAPGAAGSGKREKSPATSQREKASGTREKSPAGARAASGTLPLMVATQSRRVTMLRTYRDRLADGAAEDFTVEELGDIRATAKELWSNFSRVHDEITRSCSIDFLSSNYVKNDMFTQAFEMHGTILTLVARYRHALQPLPRVSTEAATPGASSHGSRAKLPKISLPSFSGDYSEWCSFRDLFTALVRENPDVTDVERMHYLRASTSGKAAKLIASLSLEADSFATAWETLLERYENKRILVSSHLENLLQPSVIAARSAPGLHALLHDTTEACNSLKALGAPIEHWDWVLVRIISKRLDGATREAWEILAGQSHEPPTLAQLRQFIATRARALEGAAVGTAPSSGSAPQPSGKGSRPASTPSGSRVHAVTTASTGQSCSLCSGSHYIVGCQRFKNLTNEARREKVKALRLCYNCLGRHNVTACQTVTKCKECDRKHHTMIHVGWSKFGGSAAQPGSGTQRSGEATGSSAGPSTSRSTGAAQ